MKYRVIPHRTVLLLCCDMHSWRKRCRRTSGAPSQHAKNITYISRVWCGTRHHGCCPDHSSLHNDCRALHSHCRVFGRIRRTRKIRQLLMTVLVGLRDSMFVVLIVNADRGLRQLRRQKILASCGFWTTTSRLDSHQKAAANLLNSGETRRLKTQSSIRIQRRLAMGDRRRSSSNCLTICKKSTRSQHFL